ncbi:hypothetical protein AWM75_02785 [Aerococcus urinaehominis]|uniref:Uncharacterized protein n=1 Tax=Aerococcus urinaehominis TaxID=128944 RepID=A0A0X8FKG8_9LACT|nr:ABC transporter permease [Aerococcus urinaehominis]AMB98988.1 hypothetical protein AWM75_02785 [Aerococcus urinaehominis]SDM38087.1 putative ABC transport system permease protein [Aerococcus urinaehominis]
MRISEILKSSLATMRMNGRRTFLTMVGIIIGIAAVITIMSLGNGFQKATLDSLTDDKDGQVSQQVIFQPTQMDSYDPSKTPAFSANDIQLASRYPGVAKVEIDQGNPDQAQYLDVVHAGEKNSWPVKPVDQAQGDLLAGRALNEADSQGLKAYAMISDQLAQQYFASPQAAIHQSLNIAGKDYTIVGVYPLGGMEMSSGGGGFNISDPSQILLPRASMQIFGPARQGAGNLKVYFEKADETKKVMEDLVKELNEVGSLHNQGSYIFMDMSEILAGVGQSLNMITYFVSAVAAISLLIAGVGVMNMMYISVSERTQEIGIRRAIGASQANIQQQFLFEGVAITSLGGLIGYVMGILIAKLVALALPFPAVVDWGTALMAVLISVLIGIIFSVFPARAAARKNVVEILR